MAISINNPSLHASTITVGGITNGGCVTGTLTGGGGGAGVSATIPVTGAGIGGLTSSYSVTNTLVNPSVNIHSKGIDLDSDADIKIGHQSLKETLEGIQERLAILVPDPAKLEKYEALKAAYAHYKLLERLCSEND